MTTHRSDRGVAAVEFALLTPLLLGLVLGGVEYGARFSEAQQFNNAALVGARNVAINADQAAASTAALAANVRAGSTVSYEYYSGATKVANGTGPSAGNCTSRTDGSYLDVHVTVTKTAIPAVTPLPSLLPGVANTWAVSGKAVFRCGG